MGHRSVARHIDDDGFNFVIGEKYQHKTAGIGSLTFVGFSYQDNFGYFRDSANVVSGATYSDFIRPTVIITIPTEDVEFLKAAMGWYVVTKPGDVPRQNRIIGAIDAARGG